MARIFAISDMHIFHDNIIKFHRDEFENTEQMHEHIIEEWNKVVGKDDIVINLGDVAFQTGTKKSEIREVITRLNGNQILIPGNHDRGTIKKDRHYYNDVGFKTVEHTKETEEFGISTMVINNVILSHEPIQIIPDGYINIHGHIHGEPSTTLYDMDERRMNVNVDAMGSYAPRDITDILKINSSRKG